MTLCSRCSFEAVLRRLLTLNGMHLCDKLTVGLPPMYYISRPHSFPVLRMALAVWNGTEPTVRTTVESNTSWQGDYCAAQAKASGESNLQGMQFRPAFAHHRLSSPKPSMSPFSLGPCSPLVTPSAERKIPVLHLLFKRKNPRFAYHDGPCILDPGVLRLQVEKTSVWDWIIRECSTGCFANKSASTNC